MDNTLRKKMDQAQAEYQERYGKLDWKWTDEGLPYTIQDYHGSRGSVMDFTEDDWLVCRESGYSIEEVCRLCGELWFSDEVESLTWYLDVCMGDWKDRNGGVEREIKDEEVPQDVVTDFVADFYKWRKELLPIVRQVYQRD